MRGGAGPMTETRMERNRRARDYSRACRIRRLRNAMWVVVAVLAVLLTVELIWLLGSEPEPEPAVLEPQEMAFLLEPEITESTGEAVAVDPDIIPLGSTVTVGEKTYKALGTGVHGYVVDILMSHEDAAVAGARRGLITWTTELRQGEATS